MMNDLKTYSELIKIPTFIERFRYLKMSARVGESTFGFDRWLNQTFYQTAEWKRVRREVILRDDACDLADPDHPTAGRLIIHHMNPITEKDIVKGSDILLDPEYLITVTHDTHNAIHYGNEALLIPDRLVERRPNDQCPWK